MEEPSTKEPKLDLSVVRKEPKLDQPVVRKEPKLDQPVVRKEPKLDQTVVGKEPMSDQSVVRKAEEVDREPVADSRAGLSPGTVRKKHRMAAGERICRVCGDKAVAHNFDVITCESCKTFFRRNARKTQKECAFEGKCEVTVHTRRFCPACRLQKCFDIGMRSDLILDEADRQARMEKIAINRQKRLEAAQKDSQQDNGPGITPPATSVPCQPDSCSEIGLEGERTPLAADTSERLFSEIVELQPRERSASQDSRPRRVESGNSDSSSGTVGGTDNSSGRNVSNITNGTVTCGNSNCRRPCPVDGRTRACNFQHVPKSLLPSDPLMYWRLTPEEHNLITKLTVAYQETLLQMPGRPEALTVELENLSLEMTLSDCDRFANQIISFLKHVADFRSLAIHDQQALLKANAMLCLMLKSSAVFSEERDAWMKGFGEMPVDVFARLTQHEDVIHRHASFCRSLKRILKNDHAAYVLVSCIVLFEPQAANVMDRQTVNVFQDKYSTLLKHYLESQYSYVFAAQYQEALQDSILQGKTLSADMTSMFSKWKGFMQPLMLEVINLK